MLVVEEAKERVAATKNIPPLESAGFNSLEDFTVQHAGSDEVHGANVGLTALPQVVAAQSRLLNLPANFSLPLSAAEMVHYLNCSGVLVARLKSSCPRLYGKGERTQLQIWTSILPNVRCRMYCTVSVLSLDRGRTIFASPIIGL